MIFHENRLLADDSQIISYLIFSKIRKDVATFVVCCSCDWQFKVENSKGLTDRFKMLHSVLRQSAETIKYVYCTLKKIISRHTNTRRNNMIGW